jgi:hypothetical protein
MVIGTVSLMALTTDAMDDHPLSHTIVAYADEKVKIISANNLIKRLIAIKAACLNEQTRRYSCILRQ